MNNYDFGYKKRRTKMFFRFSFSFTYILFKSTKFDITLHIVYIIDEVDLVLILKKIKKTLALLKKILYTL